MRKNVLIIDSNAEHVERVMKLALEVTDDIEIYTVDNLAHACELLMEITIDIFILDAVIDMTHPGDTSGIRLVERIRKIQKYMLTPVIFTTVEKDPTLYAYTELNCLGYMTKPCPSKMFKNVFEKALNYRTNRDDDKFVVFRKGGALYPIRIREIVYIESIAHIMHMHMSDGSILRVPYKTYSKFMCEADVDYLIQCSRSVLVNKNWVMGIDVTQNFICLTNNMGVLDIGTTYRKKIKDEFIKEPAAFKNSEEYIIDIDKEERQ